VKYLRHFCRNWRGGNCHPDVKCSNSAEEIKNGQEPPMFATGEKSERLDQICSKCDHRIFEIQKEECPVCMKNNIFTKIIIPVEPPSQAKESCLSEYFYKCTNCSTKLYSEKKL